MTQTVSAVVYRECLSTDDPASLVDVEIARPEPRPRDLLVQVEAVSVNPVDVKQRTRVEPPPEGRVLGYDASGVVLEVGSEVTLFAPGDQVYYAGSVDRPGTNSAVHVVDERIVGRKPANLTHAQAAAIPLTAITAWECLFDRLGVTADETGTILVLGGAGGVGSMAIQLVKALTKLTVIATASRPESREWVRQLGADHVVDHSGDLAKQLRQIVPDGIEYVLTPQSPGLMQTFARVVKPFGHIVAIDEAPDLDIMLLKGKAISWHWESMFTRPIFGTPDMIEQHNLLDRVADLIDSGSIRGTLTATLGPMNAQTLREAHRRIETGRTIGKIVISSHPVDKQ
ncbi:zinc-binding alcohol dehydrogenase family protein [Antricoccus suffuscus]|uniref:Zinc-type alcohol dehydrogenase-like protein n=1 Tax=Antricoccus suffuscus TaxID=1629062 RepID=A0A2T0ZVS6_9ACTN|nr:zinc-binding alcohol dehydrogenase family protein [Antricoccus suffuscus]PRZ40465.1 zinc-binding alcohol dehydrogenase family protein [Antricoccus suffuscus]